jgi:CRP-like cAMP-binding protein
MKLPERILPDLAPAARAALGAHCRPMRLGRDQFVFMEGELCRSLYILESGRVKCYRANAAGREQILKVFDRRGDTFCLTSAFKAGTHIVAATTMSETTLHVLDVDVAKRLAREHPSFALWLVSAAGDQLKSLAGLAEDLSLKSVTARLANLLYEAALVDGVRNGNEVCLRRDGFREEQIASLLGTVRVHVSRSLKRLANTGTVALTRELIRIPDLNALKQLSEGIDEPSSAPHARPKAGSKNRRQ